MKDEDILLQALDHFQQAEDATAENRQEACDDIEFARLSEQWPEEVRKQRELEGRPCLTINKLPGFVRQVVNDARQNKPGVIISPVDGEGDEATARVIQGLVRNIERRSDAEVAYDTAIDHAVSGGFGFFRIVIDYVHPDSFSLEARIERIPNPLMVHWDAGSTAFDASDWNYAFVSDFLTEEEFKARYPDADPVSWDQHDERGDVQRWMDDGRIRVAEYWCRKEKTRTILGLSNGTTIRAEVIPDHARSMMDEVGIPHDEMSDEDLTAWYLDQGGLSVVKQRESRYHEVMRYVINGKQVLESDPWPGTMIPICPVWGEEVVIGGRRHLRSMIRDAKDPQRMFNYWRTASTELVALAPRAPFVGPAGFADGHEEKWATANTRSHAYLEYNTESGAAPQRQPFAGIPAGALQEALNSSDDMKAVVGIYDASLGARSNETSGKAILARQRESDVSNFHFIDNLSHAIAYAGRVLVEIIPAVYGPSETVRILGEDGKEDVIRLTQEHGEVVDGEQRLYNLSVGVYDVAVSSGPSYQTKREETREFLMELMRQVPGAAQFIGDIVIRQFDFDGADEVAERLKMLLPPQVQQPQGIAPMGGTPGAQPLNGGQPPVSQ